MIQRNKKWIPLLILALFIPACAYIVTPVPATTPTSVASSGWAAFVTGVETSADGVLHIDLAVRNDTADWSALSTEAGKPAILTTADGGKVDCDTVYVGSGENRIPPGFQIRGYTVGTKAEPKTQLLYVECANVPSAENATLSLGYTYITGEFNFYVKVKPRTGTFTLNLNEIKTDLQFPVGQVVDGLIESSANPIMAINQCQLTLADIKRTDTGLEFSWSNQNPSEYPTYVHIGTPPVLGSDGVIYGIFQSPHLADTPITPVGGTSSWKTTVTAPGDVSGYYLLLSVESKQQRLFANHVVDITDK